MLHRRDRRVVAVHPRHAERELVVVRDRAARHQRRDRRDAGELAELAQLVGRERLDDAAAGVDDRLAWPATISSTARADVPRVAERARTVARHVDGVRVPPLGLVLQDVLRDVDEHRAGTPRRGDVEGLLDDHRDVVCVHDEPVVLGHGDRDAGDVGLLEGVAADRERVDLAGDGDHRDGVHPSRTRAR